METQKQNIVLAKLETWQNDEMTLIKHGRNHYVIGRNGVEAPSSAVFNKREALLLYNCAKVRIVPFV